jgi:hypothetical protein
MAQRQHHELACKAHRIACRYLKAQRPVLGLVLCDSCGYRATKTTFGGAWCVSCDLCLCFDVQEECISRGGEGQDGGFDVCNACMNQHFGCCGACGDVTHGAGLVWTDWRWVRVRGVLAPPHNTTSATGRRFMRQENPAIFSLVRQEMGLRQNWASRTHMGLGVQVRRFTFWVLPFRCASARKTRRFASPGF